MIKLVRAVLAAVVVTAYFALAPFGYGAFMLLSWLPTRRPQARARLLQGIMRRAFTLMHDTLRAFKLLDLNPRRIAGAPLPDGPFVLVGNHPTLCDVTASMAAFRDVTTAIKPTIFDRWWFRPLLAGALQFRGAADALNSAPVVDAAVDRISQGFRVLIFPEGTRSPEGGLHAFGRTAFEVACRANVPVVPLVLSCEPLWLSKEHGIFPVPEQTPKMVITALPAVHPHDHGFSSRRLRDVVDAVIRNRLGLAAGHAIQPWKKADARPGNPPEAPHRRVLDAGGCQPR